MTSRTITTFAILLALLGAPTAAAVGDVVYGAASGAASIANGAVGEVVRLLTPPEPEEEPAPHEESHGHGEGHDEAPPAPEEEAAREPEPASPFAPLVPSAVSRLVPLPTTTLGPAPRIDLAQLERLPPLEAPAAPAAAPRAAAPVAPAAPEAAPATAAAAAAAPVAPVAAVVAAGAATAASTGSAAAALWDRLRRFAWLGILYSRIAKERLLDHGSRERLLATIRARPGLAVADLATETAMPRNTVTYHLRVLERERLVSSAREGRNRLFFAPGSLEKREQAPAIATLRHETTLAVARAIGATPGVDQKALCERVGLSPSLAHWHADRLVASGLVDKRREGRFVRYYPGAAFGLVEGRAA